MMKKFFVSFLFSCIVIIQGHSRIVLPSVFADNMVLQQNSDAPIWGWAEAGGTIKIVASWNLNDTVRAKADNCSRWAATLRTPAAGGPYTIQIIGSGKVVLNNVMTGEVWLCSGQSNMEWSVNHNKRIGEGEVEKANNDKIRIFHVQKIGADNPQNDCTGTWTVCIPETMVSTSAVAYFFARDLQNKLNIPIGIIVSAWGGTPAEVWIEKSRIESDPELMKAKYSEKYEWWPGEPGKLYNSMIHPLLPFGIAGAIWYQGESNCGNYRVYSALMKNLIENWRDGFRKEFPFYFVQIAPYAYGDKGTSEYLREQQGIVEKTVPNTGMIVVSDLVDNIRDIHPFNKKDVGARLANYALGATYHMNVGAYKSPSFKSMQKEKKGIRLTFSDAETGLKSVSRTSQLFMIAGEDRNFVPATARIDGNTVFVSSKQVPDPVAVRYCFSDTEMPDVFSSDGLPLAPFRTDHWD